MGGNAMNDDDLIRALGKGPNVPTARDDAVVTAGVARIRRRQIVLAVAGSVAAITIAAGVITAPWFLSSSDGGDHVVVQPPGP